MKKTAIVCLSPYKGGMELDSIKIAVLLRKEGEVIFLCKENTFLAEHALETIGPDSLFPIKFNGKLSLKLIKALRGIWKEQYIHNIIFFGASELGAISISGLGLNLRVIIQHGTTKHRQKKSIYHRLVYRCVSYHVAVSYHIAQNIASILPVLKSDIKIIPTSIDTTALHKPYAHHSSTAQLSIIHAGRISEGKGQIEAVEACQVLYEKGLGFRLVFIGGIGDTQYYQRLLKKITDCSFKENVELVGFSRSMKSYYEKAHILLFPSHGEGMSNVVIESLGYGLQCVCYSNTSFPELVDKAGLHLYLAEDQNMKSLKDCLWRATENLGSDYKLLIQNTEKIKESFSLDSAREQFLKILG